ncbi:hypothetical protein [Synechococcus sp. M16CYN]|uniref:hypothetical protein n=1 Tax=Synechococcus sp. M16CYN TaxID=3103139 RepID=UPI003340B148
MKTMRATVIQLCHLRRIVARMATTVALISFNQAVHRLLKVRNCLLHLRKWGKC